MSSYNPFTLENKIILVTGASSGIGQRTAIECSKMGATIVLSGRNKERLEETFSQLGNEGHKIIIGDISKREGIENLISHCPALNGCVLSAGITKMIPTRSYREDDIYNIFNTNVISGMQLVSGLMKKKKISQSSSIVFISSVASNSATIGNGIYSASKGALNSFAKVLALETAIKDIRVNCILPGIVQTSMNKEGIANGDYVMLEKKYPLGFGLPENIADGAIFLLSDASKWITGTNMVIDGGFSLNI